MSELTFIDELPGRPPGAAPRSAERALAIKAASPKWARWPSSTARVGVQKTLDAFGPGFDAVNRKLEDGTTAVFVRYVAPEESHNGNGHAATPPPADRAPRARVKCPTCAQFIVQNDGETTAQVLARHERANVVCRARNKNRTR